MFTLLGQSRRLLSTRVSASVLQARYQQVLAKAGNFELQLMFAVASPLWRRKLDECEPGVCLSWITCAGCNHRALIRWQTSHFEDQLRRGKTGIYCALADGCIVAKFGS